MCIIACWKKQTKRSQKIPDTINCASNQTHSFDWNDGYAPESLRCICQDAGGEKSAMRRNSHETRRILYRQYHITALRPIKNQKMEGNHYKEKAGITQLILLSSRFLEANDVRSLRAAVTLHYIKFDTLAFVERTETFAINGRVMHKHVTAVFTL